MAAQVASDAAWNKAPSYEWSFQHPPGRQETRATYHLAGANQMANCSKDDLIGRGQRIGEEMGKCAKRLAQGELAMRVKRSRRGREV